MEVFLQVFLIDILSGSQICILSSMYMFSSPRKKPSHVSNASFFHKPLNFLNCHFNNQTKFLNSFFKERCFSHGQSAIERGFSINKQLLVENLQEKSFVSVHGNINSNKIKVQEYSISSDFLNSYRLANSRYIATLQDSTNLIFTCTDFRARKMVSRARSCTHNYMCINGHCGR